ncbi:hypothetical protein [Pseudoalteromonas 'SMAR']|uniref:hypothetical protein n=1 Tax=Pseudoalteromonas 'SMAR' TaxID=3416908 RepID=UPI003AF232DE
MRFLLKQLTGCLKDLTLICKALTHSAAIFCSGHKVSKRKINSPSVTSLKQRVSLLKQVIGGSTGGQVDDPRVKEENQTETQANRRVERKE